MSRHFTSWHGCNQQIFRFLHKINIFSLKFTPKIVILQFQTWDFLNKIRIIFYLNSIPYICLQKKIVLICNKSIFDPHLIIMPITWKSRNQVSVSIQPIIHTDKSDGTLNTRKLHLMQIKILRKLFDFW